MNISHIVDRAVAKAVRTLGKSVRRGTLGAAISDSYISKVQADKYDSDEHYEGVEYWQHFGFKSRAPAGTEALISEPDGSGEAAILIATQDRSHRPSISEGDAVMYSAASGTDQVSIRTNANGDIDMVAFQNMLIEIEDDIAIEANTGDIDIESIAGVISLLAGDVSIAPSGDTVIGNAVAAQPTFLGTAFNTAIGLMLTSLGLSLTAVRNCIGSQAGAGSGLAAAMQLLALEPVLTAPTAAACAAVAPLCTTAYNALGLTVTAISTFQSALTGLLTTQTKVA